MEEEQRCFTLLIGFGKKKLEKLRPHLAVEGPTTAKAVGKAKKPKRRRAVKATAKANAKAARDNRPAAAAVLSAY